MPVATNDNEGRVALVARPSTPEVTCLAAQIGLSIREREDIRVWEQSGVERLRVDEDTTVILKYCIRLRRRRRAYTRSRPRRTGTALVDQHDPARCQRAHPDGGSGRTDP